MFSTTILNTSVIDTSILNCTRISTISAVLVFTASPIMTKIVSILGTQAISARIVETKAQQSTKFLGKGKEMEEEIDLDEEIVISN